jgi:replicative DNA helicase
MNEADASDSSIQPQRQPRLRALEGGHRPLPHDLDCERCAIASLFIDPNSVLARAELMQLTPEAFYLAAHRIIFEVAREMWRKNQPVAIDTVAAELRQRQLIDQVGGYATLVGISESAPTTAQASFFLEKVFELGLLRALIRDSAQAGEDAHAYTGGLDELLGRVASKFQRLADFALRRNRKPQREVAASARAYAQLAMDGKLDRTRAMPFGGLPQVTTAFKPFDIREEDWLILIGALRSGGKSTIARQHIAHNLVAGKRFVVFLLETSRERWLNGIAGLFSGLSARAEDLEQARQLFPEKAQLFDEWAAWLESIMEEQLWIFDDIFYLEEIERQVREINRRVREKQLSVAIAAGKTPEEAEKLAYGLDGVLGDHLHIVQTRKEFRGNREREVSHIGRTLKLLHKGLNVPGFWCAQLNRSSAKDDRRASLSDLRDSGTLEQDADCVLLLHRPSENKAGNKQDGDQATHEAELIQAKRRNGPANISADLLFHLRIGSFEETAKTSAPRPGQPKPRGGYKREGGA